MNDIREAKTTERYPALQCAMLYNNLLASLGDISSQGLPELVHIVLFVTPGQYIEHHA